MTEQFKREERYLVIKISKLHPHPHFRTKQISAITDSAYGDALVDCVVVEKDWPEYEPVWQMIEQRVNGATSGQPEVVAVIKEEGEHFKETVVEHRPGIDLLPVGTELVDRAHVTRLQTEINRLNGLAPSWPPRPPAGEGLPRYGLRWNGPAQPLAVQMDDGYWTPWHLADQLKTQLTELQRADECWSAVTSYMLDAGRMEEPLEFLRCWNEGNFEAIRQEWPNAPKEVFYADPLFKGEAS